MNDLWDPSVATETPLDACVYGSRLIGSDPDLVLHGGGNTSVKMPFHDIAGSTVDCLWVKGSGWDLGSIEAGGFTPLRLERLHQLLGMDSLSDPDMMRELSAAKLDPDAPAPSVESLLHALIPHRAIQHSHADVIIALTNLADGDERVRQVFGDRVLVVPYTMPGFDLAKFVSQMWPADATGLEGIVLLNHGLFTFGDTTEGAYRRHVTLINLAEAAVGEPATENPPELPELDNLRLAELRLRISRVAAAPLIVTRHTDASVRRFVARSDLESVATRGPVTPDHVLRTKPLPLVGDDIDGYADGYRTYYDRNRHRSRTGLRMLDPAPRVILDPELGMLTVGRTAKAADIVADIYRHTIPIIEIAEDRLGGYVALDEEDLFDCEYWDLGQAKLHSPGSPPPLTGMVAIVTGAASGIGKACVAELLRRGAAVAGLDRSDDVRSSFSGPAWLGIPCDVTESAAQLDAVTRTVQRFGGIDIVVAAAGIFGGSRRIADLDRAEWRSVMAVNVDAVADLFSTVHPMLSRSPVGGRVSVIASKNVPAPGTGAAAYSASKAALTQLVRVAALEWASDGIRVNAVHPDAVFDTGLWTEELIAQRAEKYGMTVDDYKRRNLLKMEVTSAGVAKVVADLVGDDFSATTGAQIPVDGGNERVV